MAPPKRATGPAGRLAADAWTGAALDMLAAKGIDGVRVEVLAQRLQVTKGSFYWHFKDRDALLDAMLERWRQTATLALIHRLDSAIETPGSRLRALLALPITGRRSSHAADVELSIRLWGRQDPRARLALAEVDELRLAYIARLFTQCGLPEAQARPRAILAYSYMRVAASLLPADADALIVQCEAILLGEPNSTTRAPPPSRRGAAA